MRAALRTAWHLLRYAVAGAVTTAVSACAPVLLGMVPIILAILWVLFWALMYLLSALGFAADYAPDEPLGLALAPVMLVVLGAGALVAAVALTVAFTVLVVLPLALLVEFACVRLPPRSISARLASHLATGVFLGAVLGLLMLATGAGEEVRSAPLLPAGLAAWAFLTGVGAMFACGGTLTMLSAARDGVAAWAARLRASQRADWGAR